MRRPHRYIPAAVVAVSIALSACGGGNGSASSTTVSSDPQVQRGAQLVASEGCSGCHTLNGSRASGPTFKGLAGSQVQLSDGSTATADAAYLARSITDPDAQVVKGFSKGVMSAVMANRKKLAPADVDAIVAYLQTQH